LLLLRTAQAGIVFTVTAPELRDLSSKDEERQRLSIEQAPAPDRFFSEAR